MNIAKSFLLYFLVIFNKSHFDEGNNLCHPNRINLD